MLIVLLRQNMRVSPVSVSHRIKYVYPEVEAVMKVLSELTTACGLQPLGPDNFAQLNYV